jgi:hypothetical protein
MGTNGSAAEGKKPSISWIGFYDGKFVNSNSRTPENLNSKFKFAGIILCLFIP